MYSLIPPFSGVWESPALHHPVLISCYSCSPGLMGNPAPLNSCSYPPLLLLFPLPGVDGDLPPLTPCSFLWMRDPRLSSVLFPPTPLGTCTISGPHPCGLLSLLP